MEESLYMRKAEARRQVGWGDRKPLTRVIFPRLHPAQSGTDQTSQGYVLSFPPFGLRTHPARWPSAQSVCEHPVGRVALAYPPGNKAPSTSTDVDSCAGGGARSTHMFMTSKENMKYSGTWGNALVATRTSNKQNDKS